MQNEAFVSYRDYPRRRRTLERILQKLWEQDLPGGRYVEQYLRHMHRRDLTANTLRAAFTSIQGFLRFLKHQGKTDLPSLVHNDLEVFVESRAALDMALKFKPYRIAWLEEPIWPPEDFRSLARLRELSGIPIASGENACTVFQFREMMEAGAAAYIQPSVVKVGGVSEWRKIASLAEPYNVRIAPHSPYFGPGFLATAHLVASNPYADMIEHLYVNLEASVFKQPLNFEKGYFQLRQGPGLGLDIDLEVIKNYEV